MESKDSILVSRSAGRGRAFLKREKLAEEIRRQIITGRIQPGQSIPTEFELMSRHNMSRHSVRAAISILETEGLVKRIPGRGTIVTPRASYVKKYTIALAVQDPREWLSAGIAHGAEQVFRSADARLELLSVGNTQREFDKRIEDLIHSPIDGAIIQPLPWLENNEWVFRLKEMRIPFVCVDAYPEGISTNIVEVDNYLGGYLAGKHLIEKGYRRLYHISYEGGGRTVGRRFEGFLKAAVENTDKLEFCLPLRYQVEDSDRRSRSPWVYAQRFWSEFAAKIPRAQLPVGLFCVSDYEAYGVLLACQELGLKIGDEVGIVGFDDRDLAVISIPPLTTVRQSPEEIGRKAAEILLESIENPGSDYKHIKLEPSLIERESTSYIKG